MNQTVFQKVENIINNLFNPFSYDKVAGEEFPSHSRLSFLKHFSGVNLLLIVILFAYIPVWMVATRTTVFKDMDCNTTGTIGIWIGSDVPYLKVGYFYIFLCITIFTIYRVAVFLNKAQSSLSLGILVSFFVMLLSLGVFFFTILTCSDIWSLKRRVIDDREQYSLSRPNIDRSMAWTYIIVLTIFLVLYWRYIFIQTNLSSTRNSLFNGGSWIFEKLKYVVSGFFSNQNN